MENWIIDFIERFGYVSILLLILAENVFPPIPSEIILSFGGFATTYTELTVPGVITFATAGSVGGAVLLYGIGRIVDVRRLESFVRRYGNVLGLKVQDIHRANSWFERYGYWTVFFCRMVPIVRSLISIPAGMAHMRFGVFLILTLAGTTIWNTLLVSAGALLGESWAIVGRYMDVYSHIIYALLAIAGTGVVVYWFVTRLLRRR